MTNKQEESLSSKILSNLDSNGFDD